MTEFQPCSVGSKLMGTSGVLPVHCVTNTLAEGAIFSYSNNGDRIILSKT